MTNKQKLITGYLIIGLIYAILHFLFGGTGQGFFYNLGMCLVWPAVIFPAIGKFVGAIILVVVIAALLILG